MDNKPAHGQPIQPFFRVRVLDQFNNVVDEMCIDAHHGPPCLEMYISFLPGLDFHLGTRHK